MYSPATIVILSLFAGPVSFSGEGDNPDGFSAVSMRQVK